MEALLLMITVMFGDAQFQIHELTDSYAVVESGGTWVRFYTDGDADVIQGEVSTCKPEAEESDEWRI
jgi:hypothetical protein